MFHFLDSARIIDSIVVGIKMGAVPNIVVITRDEHLLEQIRSTALTQFQVVNAVNDFDGFRSLDHGSLNGNSLVLIDSESALATTIPELENLRTTYPTILWLLLNRHNSQIPLLRNFFDECIDVSKCLSTGLMAAILNLLTDRLSIGDLSTFFEYSKYELIGTSPSTKKIRDTINDFCDSSAPVLVLGESGTGKEIVARRLHRLNSRTKKGPFVAINCSAIPENLFESELFGHKKGAFSGAVTDAHGKIAAAQNGTLFLDEIGDLSLSNQTKLLRVLQENEFSPVGSNQSIKVFARIISATNRNLKGLIEQNKFREDLFYRLDVLRIETSPLRERKDDIVDIAKFYLFRNHQINITIDQVAEATLKKHDWPGNIRELHNCLERSVVRLKKLGRNTLLAEDLFINRETDISPITTADTIALPQSLDDLGEKAFDQFIQLAETRFLNRAIQLSNGNISEAARRIGIGRSTLFKKIKPETSLSR